MSRYARRVDANQQQIIDALRKVGCAVADTSAAGEGYPDLTVGFRGVVYLIEVKDGSKPPSARKLTPAQHEFHEMFRAAGVTVHVVTSVDEAIDLVTGSAA